MNRPSNPLLTPQEAAEYLGVSLHRLAYCRRREASSDPPFIRVGRRVYYRVTDLRQWVDQLGVSLEWQRRA